MINKLALEVHANAKEKGFYEKPEVNIGERIALIHSEVSEALEADRNNKYCEILPVLVNDLISDTAFNDRYKKFVKGTFEEEMADIVIRVMDMCGYKGIDLEAHIIAKMRYNKSREKYHGKKY